MLRGVTVALAPCGGKAVTSASLCAWCEASNADLAASLPDSTRKGGSSLSLLSLLRALVRERRWLSDLFSSSAAHFLNSPSTHSWGAEARGTGGAGDPVGPERDLEGSGKPDCTGQSPALLAEGSGEPDGTGKGPIPLAQGWRALLTALQPSLAAVVLAFVCW